jgi:hypothetical protein
VTLFIDFDTPFSSTMSSQKLPSSFQDTQKKLQEIQRKNCSSLDGLSSKLSSSSQLFPVRILHNFKSNEELRKFIVVHIPQSHAFNPFDKTVLFIKKEDAVDFCKKGKIQVNDLFVSAIDETPSTVNSRSSFPTVKVFITGPRESKPLANALKELDKSLTDLKSTDKGFIAEFLKAPTAFLMAKQRNINNVFFWDWIDKCNCRHCSAPGHCAMNCPFNDEEADDYKELRKMGSILFQDFNKKKKTFPTPFSSPPNEGENWTQQSYKSSRKQRINNSKQFHPKPTVDQKISQLPTSQPSLNQINHITPSSALSPAPPTSNSNIKATNTNTESKPTTSSNSLTSTSLPTQLTKSSLPTQPVIPAKNSAPSNAKLESSSSSTPPKTTRKNTETSSSITTTSDSKRSEVSNQ